MTVDDLRAWRDIPAHVLKGGERLPSRLMMSFTLHLARVFACQQIKPVLFGNAASRRQRHGGIGTDGQFDAAADDVGIKEQPAMSE